MREIIHPTNPEWILFDPEEVKPGANEEVLLVNEGGSLKVGKWYEGAIAWGYKPKIPQSVKDRLTAAQLRLRERQG